MRSTSKSVTNLSSSEKYSIPSRFKKSQRDIQARFVAVSIAIPTHIYAIMLNHRF